MAFVRNALEERVQPGAEPAVVSRSLSSRLHSVMGSLMAFSGVTGVDDLVKHGGVKVESVRKILNELVCESDGIFVFVEIVQGSRGVVILVIQNVAKLVASLGGGLALTIRAEFFRDQVEGVAERLVIFAGGAWIICPAGHFPS